MTSARTAPHDALVHWIAIADSVSRLEYSINLSAGNEAIDGVCPVVSHRAAR